MKVKQCKICKCIIEAKIRSMESECPKGLWLKENK